METNLQIPFFSYHPSGHVSIGQCRGTEALGPVVLGTKKGLNSVITMVNPLEELSVHIMMVIALIIGNSQVGGLG
jgi:hypothetical protein